MESTSAEKKHAGILNGDMVFPIYYEDTDLSGFVYHANYLKYFERAREHIIGVEYLANLYHDGVHFVVSKASLSYLAPLTHGQQVLIRSEGHFSRSPAIPFRQDAYQYLPSGDHKLVCRGEVTIVALNKAHQPVRMPERVIEHFLTRGDCHD